MIATSLQLHGIVNLEKNKQYKFRTIVSEVSSFVGNPVFILETFNVNKGVSSLLGAKE